MRLFKHIFSTDIDAKRVTGKDIRFFWKCGLKKIVVEYGRFLFFAYNRAQVERIRYMTYLYFILFSHIFHGIGGFFRVFHKKVPTGATCIKTSKFENCKWAGRIYKRRYLRYIRQPPYLIRAVGIWIMRKIMEKR